MTGAPGRSAWADVLGLRVRTAGGDRPGEHTGQPRLLQVRPARSTGRDRGQRPPSCRRGRRLGDPGAGQRPDLQGSGSGPSRRRCGRYQGHAVPRRLRRNRPRRRGVLLLPRDARGRLRRKGRPRRPRCGADSRPEHGERPRRGDRGQLPGAHRALRVDSRFRGARGAPRRARAPARLHLPPRRRDLHDPRRSRARRPARALRRPRRASRPLRARSRPERARAAVEDHDRPACRACDQLRDLRRRRRLRAPWRT